MNTEIARYLVTWTDGEKDFIENFPLWHKAMLWYRSVREDDPNAQILYWHARDAEYKAAAMPVEHEVTRRPLFMSYNARTLTP